MTDFLKSSIEMYTKGDLILIERKLKDADVIVSNDDLSLVPDSLEIILKVYEDKPEIVQKVIERFEIEKLYKYSSIFEVSPRNNRLKEELDKILSGDQNLTATQFNVIKEDDVYIIKFVKICEGVKLIDGESKKYSTRYPMLAVYYPNHDVVEIRVHTISSFLRGGESNFYNERISEVRRNIESIFSVNLDSISLNETVDYIAERDSFVKVSSQKMQLPSGGDATLTSSQSSDETVLPILGELEFIVDANLDLFDSNEKCQQIKQLLQDFIKDTKEMSELPWRSLKWPNDIKKRVIQVKFNFVNLLSTNSNDFTLMEYYNNGRGMEGMKYVTEYIIEKYRESSK